MAIKLRCVACDKKLTVDEGFAGGVCRCPYCKALMAVPEARMRWGVRPRPTAPVGRAHAPPGRPETPGEVAGAHAEVAEEHIPLARPVRIQGVLALVLMGLVVAMAAAVGILLVTYGTDSSRENGPKEGQTDQQVADGGGPDGVGTNRANGAQAPAGPSICKLQIAPPVVYCIASRSQRAFDFAASETLKSIETLKEGRRFQVALCYEDGFKSVADGYLTVSKAGLAR
ncbi:MAG: hypothetical protein ACYTF6_03015, partial [Planctomycetota bacterium]